VEIGERSKEKGERMEEPKKKKEKGEGMAGIFFLLLSSFSLLPTPHQQSLDETANGGIM